MDLMSFTSVLQRFNTANLRLRMMSAAFMAPIVLIAVYVGGFLFDAIATAAVTIGLYEWIRLVSPKALDRLMGIGCAILVAVMGAGSLFSVQLAAALGTIGMFALLAFALREKAESPVWIALGIPYMGASGLALLALRSVPENGRGFLFFLLAVVWATDIGAYITGSIIGGKKLAPSISPGKTWAGLFGGIASAVVFGFLAAAAFGAWQPAVALILSPLLAVVAQIGDLFESFMKRRAGVKESGDLIPGHGGVLDRIDGLVFAAVFAFLFQAIIGNRINWW
jgi:phosphatidate cytidylyltransferase